MNQKSLIIAIVAVVAIIAVFGLWLSGALQSGSLSGELVSPKTTTLALSMSELQGCEEMEHNRWFQFSGTLRDSSNNPVSGRSVTIYAASGPYNLATLTTDSNGAYAVQKSVYGCCAASYYAVFAGDGQYLQSQSITVTMPNSNYC
jgi:hypothetical protein